MLVSAKPHSMKSDMIATAQHHIHIDLPETVHRLLAVPAQRQGLSVSESVSNLGPPPLADDANRPPSPRGS